MKIISTGVGVMSLTAAVYLAQAAQAEWEVKDIYWSEPEMSVVVLSSLHPDPAIVDTRSVCNKVCIWASGSFG